MSNKPTERSRFERWMVEEAKIIIGSADPYPAGLVRDYWRVWQAASRAPAVDAPAPEALTRLRQYVAQRTGRRGLDPDEVHLLDPGCPSEAVLLLSDLRSLLAAVEAPAVAAQQDAALTQAARDVLAERRRLIEVEGWTPEHDDEHSHGELSKAASAYAWGANYPLILDAGNPPDMWPWDLEWWKPAEPRRMLVKATALLLADIERLDRAAMSDAKGEQR